MIPENERLEWKRIDEATMNYDRHTIDVAYLDSNYVVIRTQPFSVAQSTGIKINIIQFSVDPKAFGARKEKL